MLENNDLDKIVDDLREQDITKARTLRQLLDWQSEKRDRLFALPARMGTNRSYLMSVSLRWIADNVSFARDIPIFRPRQCSGTKAVLINSTTIQCLLQREPDYRRQLPMALYLATRRHRKFPPLLLVAYQDWVYDKNSDNWGPHGRALDSSLNTTALNTNSTLVDLDVANTSYYALDGQHRLMAIKGLRELLDGRLNAKTADGNPNPRKTVTRDELERYRDEYGSGEATTHGLLDEVMGIEVIPAVNRGETYPSALARLRSVLVDVNENAKPPINGEPSMLDEYNGFRIVARRLATHHPLFRIDEDNLRINMKSPNLAPKSECYTTLTAIGYVAREYLKSKDKFRKWENHGNLILDPKMAGHIRPDDEDVDRGIEEVGRFFDALAELPSHRKMLQGAKVSCLRTEDDNILFRPMAQVALARAVARLERKGVDLQEIMAKLERHEAKGDLELTNKKAPWFGVLCDLEGKIRRHAAARNLCADMFVYLLGGGLEEESAENDLRERFRDRRTVATEDGEKMGYDLRGVLVVKDECRLPDPWQ